MPFDNTRTMDERDGNYMVIGGVRYPVINSEIESGRGEDRMLWRIVTEGEGPVLTPVMATYALPGTEEQPPAADATVERDGFKMPNVVEKALEVLGVEPYDYTGGANFRDSGGFPILPPYTPPAVHVNRCEGDDCTDHE